MLKAVGAGSLRRMGINGKSFMGPVARFICGRESQKKVRASRFQRARIGSVSRGFFRCDVAHTGKTPVNLTTMTSRAGANMPHREHVDPQRSKFYAYE